MTPGFGSVKPGGNGDRCSKGSPFCWIDALALLLGPLIAAAALRVPSISQNYFTDSMYYLGYTQNFIDLINRYGFIYYAVRFGPIFPEMAFAQVFGALTGFHILRYLLAVSVGYALHREMKARYGRTLASLSVAAWYFNPITARMLLSTYVDSIVVPVTMLALLLVLRPGSRPALALLLAGWLLAAGVSGNVYAGVMVAFAAPAYAILMLGNREFTLKTTLWHGLWVLLGAVVHLAIFTVAYDFLFGVRSILQPAIDITLRLAGGDAKQWTRPPSEWLIDSPHIYPPFLALAGTVCVGFWRGDRLALATAAYLAGLGALYWTTDLALGGYSLSFYPYMHYWQLALILAASVIACQAVLIGPARGTRLRTLAAFGALALPATIFGQLGAPPPHFAVLLSTVAIAVGLLVFSLRWTAARPWALVGLLAAGSLLQTGSGVYNNVLGKPDSDDRDLVSAAVDLTQRLPRYSDDGKDLAIWYPQASRERTLRLKMLQSVYLPFSLLSHRDGRLPDLERLSDADARLLRNPQLSHIILLDDSGQTIPRVLSELDRHHIPHQLAQRGPLGSRRLGIEFAHVLLDHPTAPAFRDVSTTSLQPGPGSLLRYDATGATLTTGTKPYAWDATLDLTRLLDRNGPINISVTLQATRGRMSLALIRRGQPDRVLSETIIAQSAQPITVSVLAEDPRSASLLAIRNQMRDGTRGVVRIKAIRFAESTTLLDVGVNSDSGFISPGVPQ